MSWEPHPMPRVTPETEPYWATAAEGCLLLQECDECGLVYHYPRALCPDCFSDGVEWIEAQGTGSVYSYSISETVEGWPEAALPLVVAYVELKEGPRIVTNLVDCDPEDVSVGTPVEAVFVDTEVDDVAIPAFTLR